MGSLIGTAGQDEAPKPSSVFCIDAPRPWRVAGTTPEATSRARDRYPAERLFHLWSEKDECALPRSCGRRSQGPRQAEPE